jgi:hypothetical protein
MRRIVAALAVFLVSGAAVAEEPACRSGSAEVLELVSWSAMARDVAGARVTLTYKNVSADGIRMIDGATWFRDVLGTSIGGITTAPDLHLAPGETFTEEKNMLDFERLLAAAHADIVAITCVKAYVRTDGTIQRFQ